MTDKQKEAIETLFHLEHVNGYVDLYEKHDVIIKSDILLKWKNATKEVLSLIQTQQAEIDSLKDFKEIAESKVTDLTPIGLAITNQLLSRQCHKLQEESEKKDKMIDLMAEEISKSIVNTCPFADYNVDLDCENKCKDDYKACWKQYFKYKVEDK